MKKTLSEIDDQCGLIWRFDTKRFTVACWAEEEDIDPADSMEFPDAIEFARKGGSHWFCAFVGVFKRDENSADVRAGYPTDEDFDCIGYDCLGGCSYNSFEEFVSGHRQGGPENRNCLATKARNIAVCHYFPDMVRQALSEARAHEIRLQFVAA